MTNFKGKGVLLNCGGLVPQVTFQDANAIILSTTIHFQSTQSELALPQPAIPSTIVAYENLATTAGLFTDQINALQAVNKPLNAVIASLIGRGILVVFRSWQMLSLMSSSRVGIDKLVELAMS